MENPVVLRRRRLGSVLLFNSVLHCGEGDGWE